MDNERLEQIRKRRDDITAFGLAYPDKDIPWLLEQLEKANELIAYLQEQSRKEVMFVTDKFGKSKIELDHAHKQLAIANKALELAGEEASYWRDFAGGDRDCSEADKIDTAKDTEQFQSSEYWLTRAKE